jgi:N-acetylmuramoyl-L-alanine amidase
MLKYIPIVLIIFLLSCAPSKISTKLDHPPEIEIVYPHKNQTIGAVDSTFILGNITPGSKLYINHHRIPVHPEGGFLAFLPIDEGEFSFYIIAENKYGSDSIEWPVIVPEPFKTIPPDSLAFLENNIKPGAYTELVAGDLLELSVSATPGCQLHYRIDSLTDWTPMFEVTSSITVPGSETVFGADNQQDSIIGSGVYQASMYMPSDTAVDSTVVKFRLCQFNEIDSTSIDSVTIDTVCVEKEAPGKVTLKHYDYPQVVEMIDSTQTIRHGPRKGYLSIFQPKGVRFITTGKFSNYVRMNLADGLTAWIPDSSLIYLPEGTPVPYSEIKYIRTFSQERSTRVSVYLDQKLPFKVEQNPVSGEIILNVYYATSDTDWIRYDPEDDLIDYIVWDQPQDDVYRLKIKLIENQIWGYDTHYEGNVLNLDIKKRPSGKLKLSDLKIAIDPGHSSDPGSIGPTGFTEKEANLNISRELTRLLRNKGAEVVMIRSGNEHVDIYDRPKIAVRENCDIFISVHNNALPDGVNPFEHNGTSAYYYHLNSKPLAKAIQNRMSSELGLDNYGHYHANFAVIRPTQYLDVLIECTFMILPDEEAKLRGRDFPEKCAESIMRGIEDFLDQQK